MALKQRIEAIKNLYLDILQVLEGDRSENRFLLADVYQQALAADPYFPKKPVSLKVNTPANLRRKVDATCSLCVSPKKMASLVRSSKATLREYLPKLKEWLENNNVVFDQDGNAKITPVKDLKPNLKILR